jgi:hypothetical protein
LDKQVKAKDGIVGKNERKIFVFNKNPNQKLIGV